MIRIDFDEDAIVLDYELRGDPYLNAKQLAGIMQKDERFAQIVAMAIPWYQHLEHDCSRIYAQKVMEIVEEDYENFLDVAGKDVY
jgi:hypothetical protein